MFQTNLQMKIKRFFAVLLTMCLLTTGMTALAAETAETTEIATLEVGGSVIVEAGQAASFIVNIEEDGMYTLFTKDTQQNTMWESKNHVIFYNAEGTAMENGAEWRSVDGSYQRGRSCNLVAGEYTLEIAEIPWEYTADVTYYLEKVEAPTSIKHSMSAEYIVIMSEGTTNILDVGNVTVEPAYSVLSIVSYAVTAEDPSVVTFEKYESPVREWSGEYKVIPHKLGSTDITMTITFFDGSTAEFQKKMTVIEREQIIPGKEYTMTDADYRFDVITSTHDCGYKLEADFSGDTQYLWFDINTENEYIQHVLNSKGVEYSTLTDGIFKFAADTAVEINVWTDDYDEATLDTVIYRFLPNHELIKTDAVEATFEASGNIEYYTCSNCDTVTSDAEGCNEITLAETVIPQLKMEDGKIEVEESSVKIPVDTLQEAAEDESLTVGLEEVTVILDKAALEAITAQAESNITLTVKMIDKEALAEEQKAAIADKNVVGAISATILNNGEEIHDFDNGLVTIKIPFMPAEGTNGANYSILYVADDGSVEVIETTYENGYLVMTTDHFSEYVIIYNAPSTDNDSSDNIENNDSDNSSAPVNDNNDSSTNNNESSSGTENSGDSSKTDSLTSSIETDGDSEKEETLGTPDTGDNAQTVATVFVAVIAMMFMVVATAAKKKMN